MESGFQNVDFGLLIEKFKHIRSEVIILFSFPGKIFSQNSILTYKKLYF